MWEEGGQLLLNYGPRVGSFSRACKVTRNVVQPEPTGTDRKYIDRYLFQCWGYIPITKYACLAVLSRTRRLVVEVRIPDLEICNVGNAGLGASMAANIDICRRTRSCGSPLISKFEYFSTIEAKQKPVGSNN